MSITRTWGKRLLAAYLILIGLIELIPQFNFIPGIVLTLLALAAGILLLLDR